MKNNWKKIAWIVVMTLSGCGTVANQVKNGRIPNTINQEADRGKYFESIGIGAADPAIPTETQRKSLARDAAIVKAQYEMLSLIEGVKLTGGITVKKAMESDSNIKTEVNAVIKGAEVVKSEFTSDNGCVVTLRLSKSRLADVLGNKL